MDATAAVHPTDPILQSYGLGKLDEVSSESVSRHLESCSDCRNRVAEMSPDSFLGRLRDAGIKAGSPVSAPVVSSFAGMSMLDAGGSSASPPPADSLPPGLAEHPDYEVIRELGHGGMGTVYLAMNRLMGRHEVLKVVSSHLMNRRGVLDRFLVEIRNAARLHHTNIVTAYSASRVGESVIFAMEFVDGLDLAKLVKAKGALPVANACNYAHQAALGLQHAGELGMVHRDIKPSNLMLAKQGNRAVIKVLDFGLAKVKSERAVDGGLTHEGQMLGTPDFIAPEQIRDARDADIRADIYSLGCTLYYLLTGGPPFHATSLYEILQAHHSMDALPLNLARPEVPVELAALVARMMAKEPARRFQTPTEVGQALVPFFKKASLTVAAPTLEMSRGVTPRSPERTDEVPWASTRPGASEAPEIPPTAASGSQPERARAPVWDSLIEFKAPKPVTKDVPSRLVAPKRKKHPRLSLATAAAIVACGFFAVWAAAVLSVKTPKGNLEGESAPKPDESVLSSGFPATKAANSTESLDSTAHAISPVRGPVQPVERLNGEDRAVVHEIEIKNPALSAPTAILKTEQASDKATLATPTPSDRRVDAKKTSIPHGKLNTKVAEFFQPGSVWTGRETWVWEGKKGHEECSATLTVRELEGTSFRARYAIPNKVRDVRGTIEGNQIAWSGEDVADIKGHAVHFDGFGTIRGQQIVIRFFGQHRTSHRKMRGTITLRQER